MESWTVFCAFRGLGAVTIQRGTSSGGGMFQDSGWGCSTPHFSISLLYSYLAAVNRPDRDDPAEKGRTIATPLFCRWCGTHGGGHVTGHVTWPVPPLWGSLSSYLSLREGFGQDPEHKPQAGADAPKENPIKWRYPVLISGGFCCSAWGFL